MAVNEKYITYSEAVSILYSNVKYLYFSSDRYYSPIGGGNIGQGILTREIDGTNTFSSVTQSSTAVTLKLRNEIIQNKTTNNAWYPAAVGYYTYSQYNNANVCLPIGYQQNITINPYSGKLRAKDFIIISGNTEISVLEKLQPQPSAFTINLQTIATAVISAGGEYPNFSNLVMTLTTDNGSCNWNFGTKTAGGTDIQVNNISPSRTTLTCSKNYTPRLSFSGTMNGRNVSGNYLIYIGELSQNHLDYISKGDTYCLLGVSNGDYLPYSSSVTVDIDFIYN